jgi:hypothetical protein
MTRTESQRRSILHEVNERIRVVTASFVAAPHTYSLLCECGRSGCLERVELTFDEYAAHGDGGYLVRDGHERLAERIVARGMSYAVVA